MATVALFFSSAMIRFNVMSEEPRPPIFAPRFLLPGFYHVRFRQLRTTKGRTPPMMFLRLALFLFMFFIASAQPPAQRPPLAESNLANRK